MKGGYHLSRSGSKLTQPSRQEIEGQKYICLQALKQPSATLDRVGSVNLSKAMASGKSSMEMPEIFARQKQFLD